MVDMMLNQLLKLSSVILVLTGLLACGSSRSSKRYDDQPKPADRFERAEQESEDDDRRDDRNDRNDQESSNQGRQAEEVSEPSSPIEPPSECIEADPTICAIEKKILELTNSARADAGLSPLQNDAKVAFVSRDWSQQQAQSGGIGHQGFPSQRVTKFIEKFGSRARMSAENVAYSFFRGSDADQVAKGFMNMWLSSFGHRRNILGGYKGLGVGIFKDQSGAFYATQIFTN